ncbi:MAG: ABC transporter substrate-binding protein, partial [Clostridia bacterium]|nr:ABC transporter substrate-binding protein [Clostridia bacterium]
MKRLIALVLAAAMCLTLVSFASAEDDKTPITFRFYNADGKNADWDNPVAAAITAATGVTLKVE